MVELSPMVDVLEMPQRVRADAIFFASPLNLKWHFSDPSFRIMQHTQYLATPLLPLSHVSHSYRNKGTVGQTTQFPFLSGSLVPGMG